jgi:hypothetical protein
MRDAGKMFEAFDEAGERYTVHVHRESCPVGDQAGKVAGGLRLGNGEVVTRHSQGLYSIARTGVRLTSTDRHAH